MTRDSPITDTATDDVDWIPEVARRGWLIITRDSRIQHHPAEIEAVRAAEAPMLALAGKEAIGVWNQLEVLMSQWRGIESLLEERPVHLSCGTDPPVGNPTGLN